MILLSHKYVHSCIYIYNIHIYKYIYIWVYFIPMCNQITSFDTSDSSQHWHLSFLKFYKFHYHLQFSKITRQYLGHFHYQHLHCTVYTRSLLKVHRDWTVNKAYRLKSTNHFFVYLASKYFILKIFLPDSFIFFSYRW